MRDGTDGGSLLVELAEHLGVDGVHLLSLLVDLNEPVAGIAHVPGDVAVHEALDGVHDEGVLVLEDGDHLLGGQEGVLGQLLEGLLHGDLERDGVVLHQAGLVADIVKLLVEGHEIVDPHHPVVHLADGGGDFEEELLLVVEVLGPQGGADAVAETVETTKESGVVVRSRETVEAVLLDPAALEEIGDASLDVKGGVRAEVLENVGHLLVHEHPPGVLLLATGLEVVEVGLHDGPGVVLAVVEDESVCVVDGEISHELLGDLGPAVDDHADDGLEGSLELSGVYLGSDLEESLDLLLSEMLSSLGVGIVEVLNTLLASVVAVTVVDVLEQADSRVEEVIGGKLLHCDI